MDDFIACIGGMLLIITICLSIAASFNIAHYHFDKSMCKVYVNTQLVYDDRCHFINIHSIGENGNTKLLTIYKDIILFRPKAKYLHENIKISN